MKKFVLAPIVDFSECIVVIDGVEYLPVSSVGELFGAYNQCLFNGFTLYFVMLLYAISVVLLFKLLWSFVSGCVRKYREKKFSAQ